MMKRMKTCQETSRILASEEPLSWFHRAEARLHLAMCDQCTKYAAQLRILRESTKKAIALESTKHEAEIARIEQGVVHKHAKP